MYTRVSSFLQWIKNTILSNGGGVSCSFSFIDSPRLGNTKSDLCYMCATLLQKQKKEPENTTAFSSTFSEVNFPIQLKWTVAIIMLKAVLLVLRWYLSSNLLMNYLIEMKIMVMEIIIYVTGEWRCLVPGRLHLVQWQLWTKWCLLFLCFFINIQCLQNFHKGLSKSINYAITLGRWVFKWLWYHMGGGVSCRMITVLHRDEGR